MRGWPPISITTDKLGSYRKAIRRLQRDGHLSEGVTHRTSKYLTDVFDKTFFAEWCYPLPARVTAWPRASIDESLPRRLSCACPICGARAPDWRFGLPVRNETRVGTLGLFKPGAFPLPHLLAVIGMSTSRFASLCGWFAGGKLHLAQFGLQQRGTRPGVVFLLGQQVPDQNRQLARRGDRRDLLAAP
jgi:hypothetical protein